MRGSRPISHGNVVLEMDPVTNGRVQGFIFKYTRSTPYGAQWGDLAGFRSAWVG